MRPSTRFATLLLVTLTGCQFSSPAATGDARMDADVAAPAVSSLERRATGVIAGNAQEAESPGDPAAFRAPVDALPAMIIRNGQASLEVDSLERSVTQVRQLADRLGGYVANSQMQAGANQLRSATLELKVPAARFDELTRGLAPIGRVEYVNVTAEDVGEEFTDVSARVANSHRLEERLIGLLATRTGKLSDVLEIERELARVREEIERMEGRLRYLKSHAAISTLSVAVHEPTPLVGQQGSGSVILESFRQAWRNAVGFTARAIASLGTLLPLAILLVAGLFGIRALWRRGRAR
jgi:hypothetical protein